jgi:hypothetical protein
MRHGLAPVRGDEQELTSAPAVSRCEAGEDFPAEQALEHLIDDDPPRGLLKHLPTLLRAILVRRQRPRFAMQYFARLFLSNELARGPHRAATDRRTAELVETAP